MFQPPLNIILQPPRTPYPLSPPPLFPPHPSPRVQSLATTTIRLGSLRICLIHLGILRVSTGLVHSRYLLNVCVARGVSDNLYESGNFSFALLWKNTSA